MSRERWIGIALLVVGCSSPKAGCGLGSGCAATADEVAADDAGVTLTAATIDTPSLPAPPPTATDAPQTTGSRAVDPASDRAASTPVTSSSAQTTTPDVAATSNVTAERAGRSFAPATPSVTQIITPPKVDVNVQIVTTNANRGDIVDAGASVGVAPGVVIVGVDDGAAPPPAPSSTSGAAVGPYVVGGDGG